MPYTESELREVERLKETVSREPLNLDDMLRITRSLHSIETANLGRINREIEERAWRTRVRRFFERFY